MLKLHSNASPVYVDGLEDLRVNRLQIRRELDGLQPVDDEHHLKKTLQRSTCVDQNFYY